MPLGSFPSLSFVFLDFFSRYWLSLLIQVIIIYMSLVQSVPTQPSFSPPHPKKKHLKKQQMFFYVTDKNAFLSQRQVRKSSILTLSICPTRTCITVNLIGLTKLLTHPSISHTPPPCHSDIYGQTGFSEYRCRSLLAFFFPSHTSQTAKDPLFLSFLEYFWTTHAVQRVTSAADKSGSIPIICSYHLLLKRDPFCFSYFSLSPNI